MNTQFSYFDQPYTLFLLATTIITWIMAAVVWRYRDKPGGTAMGLMLVAMGVWSLGSALEFMAVTLETKDFWVKLAWVGVPLVPTFLLLAAVQQTGHQKLLKLPVLVFLLVMPVVTIIVTVTNNYHHLMWRSVKWASLGNNAVVYDFSYWFQVHILFVNGAIITAIILFSRLLKKQSGIYRGQAAVALLALGLPWIANMVYLFGWGPGVDLTPIAFGLTGLLIALAFVRFRLLDLTPIAYVQMFESMPDGVITLDTQNRIADINPAAQRLLAWKNGSPVGRNASEILTDWPEIRIRLTLNDQPQTEFFVQGQTVNRCLCVKIVPVTQSRQWLGWLVVLHDVTALKQAEAELQQKTDETAKMAEEIARLFEEEQTQRKMAESLRQTAVALNSSLDYQIVVRKILSLVRDVVNYDSVGLFLQMEDKLVLTDGVALDTLIFGYQIALNSPNRTAIVFNRRSPDIVDDVRTDPYWEALPPFGDKIRSWMAVPLLLGNRAIGVVTVDSYTTNVYEQRDAQVLQIFANQAAVAVENTRLHRQAQTAAALEERNRLAQDLHDAVNQTLFSAGLIAEAVPDIWEEDPEQGRLGLQELRVLTQSALAEMRSLLLELRPTSLTNKNLGELMTYLIRAVTARTRIPIELTVEADNRLPPEVQVTVYRIAQEAFNNISKHAKADQIAVTLNCRADEMTLSIGDNGCGFNPDALTVGHLGLGIMRERAKSVNARLEIISRPGAGTRIILTWQENDKK